MWRRMVPVLTLALTLGACATAPQGPSVMVLPGPGKPLDQFQLDDAACRQWAAQQVGSTGDGSWMLQRRYDIAYQQCMYSRGNDLPGFSRPGGPAAPPPAPGQRVPAPPPGAGTPPPNAPPPPPPAPGR